MYAVTTDSFERFCASAGGSPCDQISKRYVQYISTHLMGLQLWAALPQLRRGDRVSEQLPRL